MRGLMRRWMLREVHSPTDRLTTLDLPPLLERILRARGLTDPETIQRFRDPKLTDLHDPSLLPGVDAAAQRLVRAAREGQAIAIYGDYDVDGITATAVLYHTVRAAAPNVRVITYVPHRLEEGYGLNAEALTQLRERGADVVVSVDCGITAVEPVRAARASGLDVIITDHHTPPAEGEPLPEAILVHPGLPGSTYPFDGLCGAGVAFKLAWRFASGWCGSDRVSGPLKKTLVDMLALTALGTIADVVPLLDENRIITTWGLRLIKETPIAGLRALIEASNLADEKIDSEKVGFVIAPRLNACGRMGHAEDAVHLLTAAHGDEAVEIAERLTKLNDERRRTERQILADAERRAEELGMIGDDRRVIVLADEAWHPGVVGIVCSRLVDRFGRPAVLLQQQGDVCRGSARSIDGYSIYDGIASTASLLTAFGGHEMAAGLTIPTENLEAFTTALTEHANAHIDVDHLLPSLRIDCDACLPELDRATVQQIAGLSPFGRANREPSVRVLETTLAEPPRPIGAKGNHVALRFRQLHGNSHRTIRGVWWGNAHIAENLRPGMPLDIVIRPRINEFRNQITVEADVRDVRVR